MRKYSKEYELTLGQFIIMLAPIMPHFAATLWFGFTSASGRLITECKEIDWNANVLKQKWPVVADDTSVEIAYRVSYGSRMHKVLAINMRNSEFAYF